MVECGVISAWTNLPEGAVLVCASVLTVGVPAAASAREHEHDPTEATELSAVRIDEAVVPAPAPTCGPCCHGGGPDCEIPEIKQIKEAKEVKEDTNADQQLEPPPDPDPFVEEPEPDGEYPIETAPTCGECCHGGDPELCGPPPIEPGRKGGCAVEDPIPDDPLPAAILGIGALALALRRRRDS